jgi:Predicted membrane protein (DUF2339)
MAFWIFLLFVWVGAEWVLRRRERAKNDQRFANVIGTLNRAERDFNELKRLTARVAELEKAAVRQREQAGAKAPDDLGAEMSELKPQPLVKQPDATEHEKQVVGKTPATAGGAALPQERPSAATPVWPTVEPAHPPVTPVPPRTTMPPAAMAPGSLHAESTATAKAAGPSSVRVDETPATTGRPAPPTPSAAAPPGRPRGRDIEQILGTNWLNKIGIAALVIGVALFLAYKFPTLTNAEKVGLGYFVSFAVLGTGVFLERKDVYRIFARALIGGGWALVFFTTYAMYFVTYTRVIDTEWVDLLLLFAVAWLMVVHTLHYNSQVVTGLAFLLGFTTVAISQNTVYCLAAGAILAFGLVAIVHKRSWFELEVFGLIASYVNHYIWLRGVIEPMGAERHMFAEFVPSSVLLCTYWALYRWSYVARRTQTAAQEHVSTLAALLNTALLLFLFKYQSVRPQLAFYALLVLGAIELTLGQLPVTRKRRAAMVILSTIGIVLLVAAVPFKYSGMGTAILWLIQAETLIFAGVLTRETLFRRFGFLTALLTTGYLLATGAFPVVETRMSEADFLHAAPEWRLAVAFLFAGVIFVANAEWIPRTWKEAAESEFEQICFRALSYLGGFAAFIGLWLAFPNLWTAVAWAGAAVLLAAIGRLMKANDLSYQANWLVLAGFGAALSVNVDATSSRPLISNIFAVLSPRAFLYVAQGTPHFSLAFWTITMVIAALYVCAYLSGPVGTEAARIFSAIQTWAAMVLLLALTLQEAEFAWIAVVWAVFGLLLLIAAERLKRGEFVMQAAIVSAFAAILSLTVNLYAGTAFSLVPQLSLRLVTMTLVSACFYASAWWARRIETGGAAVLARAYTWAASFLIWMLLLYELSALDVALGWALFGLALFESGIAFRSFQLRVQAYCVLATSLARVFFVNVNYSRHDLVVYTLPLAIVFYYVHWRAEMQRDDSLGDDQRIFAGPILSYFGTVTVATVLYCALDAGWVAAGWAALALGLIAMAWALERDVLLHHAMLMAFAVLFRTMLFDLAAGAMPGVTLYDDRAVHVVVASGLLFACLAFAFPLRKRFAATGGGRKVPEAAMPLILRPEQLFFFVALIQVTALIARDVAEGRVTMAWGVEAVIVFLFALAVGERSFRLTGLGLLLLCVGKILVLDVWRQDKADRFTTFIILGVALLLVSFLYTRYSETIRRYL